MGNKVIVRLKGGPGNQLFCYAAAMRLAKVSNAELVVDNVTGFIRDITYRHYYLLDHFRITARMATPAERLEPHERVRRGVLKLYSNLLPYNMRPYVEQHGSDFDSRLLSMRVRGRVWLDGYWQSELYFADIQESVRREFVIIPPTDEYSNRLAATMSGANAVALHVRYFESPDILSTQEFLSDYYRQAIKYIRDRVQNPIFFVFSNAPEAAARKIGLDNSSVVLVERKDPTAYACADLWLMTQCRHFITANSTLSWWGAWLSGSSGKLIITPDISVSGISAWGFKGLIPEGWIRIGGG